MELSNLFRGLDEDEKSSVLIDLERSLKDPRWADQRENLGAGYATIYVFNYLTALPRRARDYFSNSKAL